MIGKKQLFDDDEEGPSSVKAGKNEIKVNKDFADKYEERQKKKLLAKGKEMESEESSSEYSDEDSEGVLINDQVEQKFLETIARIRANDPTLKQQKEDVFGD
jgi:protein KRI1